MTVAIVFYDGDGGGLCGQLRSRFECYILSKITDLPVYDAYPYIHYLFPNALRPPDNVGPSNSHLYSILASQAESFGHLCSIVSNCSSDYILVGRHHYSQLFRKFIRTTYSHKDLIAEYKDFFQSLGSYSLINNLSAKYSGVAQASAVHVRTMVDSPAGNKLWKSRRPEFYGWLFQSLKSCSSVSQDDHTVYLACDCAKETSYLQQLCRQAGLRVILGEPFSHSSLANVYGRDLFLRTDDIKYQVYLVRAQMLSIDDQSSLNLASLVDLFRMMLCRKIFATESTYSQMAYLIGCATEYHCFGYEDGRYALLN